jgi:cleavage and polyadenylation specificity factor subunit 3
MIRFLPLGGGGEIGANSYYLNISGTGIILDCGMHPQKTGLEALPGFDLIKDEFIDYVLISHAHQDHLSSLPFLVQRFPYVKIITTPQTRALAELTLHDSISILKEQPNVFDGSNNLKIYSHSEIDLLIQSIEYRTYKEEVFLEGYKHNSGYPVKASFHDAGHILGSAGILLEFEKRKIFYTGDIKLDKQSIMNNAQLPSGRIDTLILETTYGSTDSSILFSWEKEAERFALEANKILNAGGSILIPVFSLGKTQEMLATIWKLIQKGKLTQTDIYTGGIGTKISRVYDYNRYVVEMQDPEFELKSVPQKNIYSIENIDNFFKSPCIVLASSGMMLEKTASFRLAKKWIKQKSSAIFTVGFMEESTPGYRFANAVKGSKIRIYETGKEVEVKCTIKNFRFPSHAKRESLLEIVTRLKPKNVILVHGDPASINWVGANILKHHKDTKVFSAEIGKDIVIN